MTNTELVVRSTDICVLSSLWRSLQNEESHAAAGLTRLALSAITHFIQLYPRCDGSKGHGNDPSRTESVPIIFLNTRCLHQITYCLYKAFYVFCLTWSSFEALDRKKCLLSSEASFLLYRAKLDWCVDSDANTAHQRKRAPHGTY